MLEYISKWAQCNRSVLITGKQEWKSEKGGEKLSPEVAVMHFEDRGKAPEPKNAGSSWELEKAKKTNSLQPSKEWSLMTTWLWLSETHFGLLTSTTVRIELVLFQATTFVRICYSSSVTLMHHGTSQELLRVMLATCSTSNTHVPMT